MLDEWNVLLGSTNRLNVVKCCSYFTLGTFRFALESTAFLASLFGALVAFLAAGG